MYVKAYDSALMFLAGLMNSFENRVYNFIREKDMIHKGSTVVVGFSGGADSTALMLVLFSLKDILEFKLVAVHLNHGIREEAGLDADFCRKFCSEREIEFELYEKDIPALAKELRLTEEEAGRRARYEAFGEVLDKNGGGIIAVAHHQNDVAESLLMNLLRGSGLHGAGSIRAVRDNVIRPLLCVSRKEIEDYLKEKCQDYCRDATNDENDHTRNVIRNEIIPILEDKVNQRSVEHLGKAAQAFIKADDYVRKISFERYKALSVKIPGGIELELEKFRELDEIIRENVVLFILEELTPARKDITSTHVEDILKLCEGTSGSAQISLPYSLIAERSYNKLVIKLKDTKNSSNYNNEYLIPPELEVGDFLDFRIPKLGMAHISVLQYNDWKLFPTSAYTKWFDYDRIQGAVFRNRLKDDYILLERNDDSDGLCKKKISKLMTDEKIPRSERDEIYLLADGNNILWIPGYRMSGAFKVSDSTQKVLEIKIDIDNGGKANG